MLCLWMTALEAAAAAGATAAAAAGPTFRKPYVILTMIIPS